MNRSVLLRLTATALAGVSGGAICAASPATGPVPVATLPVANTIDERFQSFQIGFSQLTGGETWKSYDALAKDAAGNTAQPKDVSAVREARAAADLTNRRLNVLTKALSPLYIRYSGTTANSVYFQDNDRPPAKPPEGFTVVLTRSAWKSAIDFAKSVDAKVLTSFANSPGVRDSNHAWTPLMAAPWLAYNRSIGGEIYAAELFNEPNAPEPPRAPTGFSVPEFTRDFALFRRFMTNAAPTVKLAGPGNAILGFPTGETFMPPTPEAYASGTPRPRFDIVSYHFYPALAQRCAPANSPQGVSPDQALTEGWLARPDKTFQRVKALRDRFAPGAPIWLTETGGAACGGLIWQPTFLDMFRFLDTESRLAKQGLAAMFTHALFSGSNGIIDEKTFEPNASYWGALLWRKLMGTRVLDAGPLRPGFHLYAQCQRGVPGGVALLALNLGPQPQSLRLPTSGALYALTSPDLQSKTVLLNGRVLQLGADDTMPAITPREAEAGDVTLAPTSVNFIAIPQAHNRSCR